MCVCVCVCVCVYVCVCMYVGIVLACATHRLIRWYIAQKYFGLHVPKVAKVILWVSMCMCVCYMYVWCVCDVY